MHWIPVALDFALAKAGKSMPAKMAMMAMTTSNSMRVNPRRDVEGLGDRKVIEGSIAVWKRSLTRK
jgi:hypothetical protein